MNDLMQNRPYQSFVLSSGFTNFADGVAMVAWAWLASLLTRDPLLIAIVPVALRLPWVLFAIPAGIVTDRVDRRLLILAMDAVRAFGFAIAAFAVWAALPLGEAPSSGTSNGLLYVSILGAALIIGCAEVFRDNAAQTMLPALVGEADLERANGRLWSVELVGQALLGPALGAFLIAAALPLPFAVNACAYLLAILLVARISGAFRPALRETRDWRAELWEGYAFLKANPLLRDLALITGFWNLLFQAVVIGLVLHVQENLGLGAQAYGLILAGGALGGILGGWLGDRIVARLGQARTAQIMLASSAPAFVAIAFAPNALALGLVLALFEFTGIVWNTVSVSHRQRVIPDVLLGRVNSLYRLLAWGMMPVGLLAAGGIVLLFEGFLTRETALITPFLAAALGAVALSVFGWRALGRGFER